MRQPRFPVRPWIAALVAAAALVIHALPDLALLLEDRCELAGALWRPFTGHLAHRGAMHLLLNLALFL
ncbi:MAG: hypothetical protein JXA90_08915, partial [Planctomycetes bacterium]|nr:hypothetical protein [Planctomycetota bacterium]